MELHQGRIIFRVYQYIPETQHEGLILQNILSKQKCMSGPKQLPLFVIPDSHATVRITVMRHNFSSEIPDYRGLHKRAPVLAGVMLVGLLSLAGIPGTAGFLGKLFVFGAAIQFNTMQTLILAVVAVLTTVVAAFYYLNIVRQMYFEPAEDGAERVGMSVGARVGLAVTAVDILVLGVYPQPFLDFATESMQMLGLLF